MAIKSIPRKYFKAKNTIEALMNIRRFLAAGLSVEQIAQQINEQYPKASDENKQALGKLLASVYDFKDREAAKKCAEIFGLFPFNGVDPQRTVSYQILSEEMDKSDLGQMPWLDQIDRDPLEWYEIGNGFDKERYWMVVPPKEVYNPRRLADNVYCIVEPSFTVNFLAIVDCPLDMLIDEDLFNEVSEPLYFTECTCFISPVFKVRTAKKIFEYCLERMGFPYVNIKLNVLFASKKGVLINKAEFMEGGQYAKDWEGVQVSEIRNMDKRKGFMFRSISLEETFMNESYRGEYCMMEGLLKCINATAELYRELDDREKLTHTDRRQLTSLAKKLELFQPKE